MRRIAMVLLLTLVASPLWGNCPDCFFYGGDYDPNNYQSRGLPNENDANVGGEPYGAATYQNFVCNPDLYWCIASGLFTNNLSSLNPSSAYWEIRTGMFEGNGGTVVVSGTASGGNFSHTPTGRSGLGLPEYTDAVSFEDLYLTSDTYWFAVVPLAPDQDGRSFNSNTFGLNSVGTQILDQQYWNSAYFGANFTNADNEGILPSFSSGVYGGYFIPEPSTLVMVGSGLVGAAITVRRRIRR